MTALSVWPFDTHEGAAHDEKLLEAADRDHLVKMLGHAVVSWGCDDQELTHEAETRGDVARHWLRSDHPPGAYSGQFPLFLVTQEGDLDRLGERLRACT